MKIWLINSIALVSLSMISILLWYLLPFGPEGTIRLALFSIFTGIISLAAWQEWNTIVDGTKDYLVVLAIGIIFTSLFLIVEVFRTEISFVAILNGEELAWQHMGNTFGVGDRPFGLMAIGWSLASLIREVMLNLTRRNLTMPRSGRAKTARH